MNNAPNQKQPMLHPLKHRHSFYPTTATNTELAYTFDTANVVSIDEYNVLHAVAAGAVTVTTITDTGVSTTFTVTVTDPDFIILPGDVNDDGVINIIDLIKMKKYIVGMITLTGRSFTAANLQEDQSIDSLDLIKLCRILLGIE